ncbi:tetratricopeptide repeat-containing sensor histidine kinase [Maribacter sp. 2-571]|uniref:tetratricopeptide repeat-containing sensor histidine kinase n=1 Tax=Maribacter sp. 2-571 TaxID=3417569 RepID=UPI003D33F0EA
MDSSYYHYAKAQKIYDGMGNDFYSGRMLYNMGFIQGRVKDYTGAEINLIKAIELLKPLKKNKQLHMCYNWLGMISAGLKEYDNSIRYYNKALDYAKSLPNYRTKQIQAQNNIGSIYLRLEEYDRAERLFEDILNSNKNLKIEDPRRYSITLINLTQARYMLEKNDKAEENLRETLKIRTELEDSRGIASSNFHLAEFYLRQKDTVKALHHGILAKKVTKQSNDNQRMLETLLLLGVVDSENGVQHTLEYIALNDSLQQEERKTRNKFARIRFETNETIEQNRLLAQQKRLWIGIAVVVVLLALAAFLFFDQRAKNQKLRFQKEQQENNEKIFNLLSDQSQKVEEGKKIAQKRISEELHDGVQGRLQGVRMLLLGLNKRTTPEAIDQRSEAIKELQDIQEEVRAISHELSHAAYQKIHNFIKTIEDLLANVKESAKLDYSFEYDDSLQWDNLGSAVKVNLYRMVQESIQNCVKHAAANQLKLVFHLEKETLLRVSLIDDGKGFTIKKGRKGIGMRNIASRIAKINGEFDIESAPGKGTTVTFLIPIASLQLVQNQI